MNNIFQTVYRGKDKLNSVGASITADIIATSKRCNQNRCMVADVIQEKYPSATHIWVDGQTIRLTLDGLRYWFLTPHAVKKYIIDFDQKKPVQPFSFRTDKLARIDPAGIRPNFVRTNFTQYDPAKKKRKYAQRVRVNGVCVLQPIPV